MALLEQLDPEQLAPADRDSLALTLDLGLQRLADALLEGWNGAIVAMDPRDGAVLAMAATPNGLIGASGHLGQKRTIMALIDSVATEYGDDWAANSSVPVAES